MCIYIYIYIYIELLGFRVSGGAMNRAGRSDCAELPLQGGGCFLPTSLTMITGAVSCSQTLNPKPSRTCVARQIGPTR